jgi:TolB protein
VVGSKGWFVVLLAALLALPTSAQASFPGRNGRIAYSVIPPGAYPERMQSIDELGGDLRMYTYGGNQDWSPGGNQLAFSLRDDGIYTMDAAGRNVTQLVTNFTGDSRFFSTSWSRDGSIIVFGEISCSKYGCSEGIEGVNSDGSGLRGISAGRNPEWSPVDDRIAVDYAGDVYTVNSDGSGGTQLTTSTADDMGPDWSPNGTKIAFASNRDGNYEIYVMNADGTGQTRITNTAAQETKPAWSPDGTKIVFERSTNPDPVNCWDACNAGIYKMNADGSSEVRLTPDGTNARHPDWGPNVGYARPRGASPIDVALVPNFWECAGGQNAQHGPPLQVPSCSPATHPSEFLTIGTPDANGAGPNSAGTIHLKVRSCPQCASPLPPDLLITAKITDVRDRFSFADYTGELEGVLNLRLTDSYNGPPYNRSATLPDVPISFAITCTSTADTAIGSTCATSTSANALMPGLVRDYSRAVWQLGQVGVNDGGVDGDAETQNNSRFMRQGLFVP